MGHLFFPVMLSTCLQSEPSFKSSKKTKQKKNYYKPINTIRDKGLLVLCHCRGYKELRYIASGETMDTIRIHEICYSPCKHNKLYS